MSSNGDMATGGRQSKVTSITLEMMESCEQSGQTLMVRDTGLMQVQGKCLKDALHLEAHGIIYRKKTDI